jgi:hypothetical protein
MKTIKSVMLVAVLALFAVGCNKQVGTTAAPDTSGLQPVVANGNHVTPAQRTWYEKIAAGENPWASHQQTVVAEKQTTLADKDLEYAQKLEGAMGDTKAGSKALDYAESLVHVRALRLQEAVDKDQKDKFKPLAFSLAEARQKQLEAMRQANTAVKK